MFDFFKKLFDSADVDFSDLMKKGATIIDVRTDAEYSGGHIKNSKNIPLQDLPKKLSTLNKNHTIIVCCASGIRSASAKTLLQKNGFQSVYNGGGWKTLEKKLFR